MTHIQSFRYTRPGHLSVRFTGGDEVDDCFNVFRACTYRSSGVFCGGRFGFVNGVLHLTLCASDMRSNSFVGPAYFSKCSDPEAIIVRKMKESFLRRLWDLWNVHNFM